MSSGTPHPPPAQSTAAAPSAPGERVQITDERGRITTITLAEGGEYHSHKGFLKHDDLIGAPEGTVIPNTHGILYQRCAPSTRTSCSPCRAAQPSSTRRMPA